MASAIACKASSSTSRKEYDVFLSFRGKDTRANFVAHLFEALNLAKIPTFKDNIHLESGENIGTGIHEAIESSKAAVIVFSENYASSHWCLDELVFILERKSNFGLKVIPVFYKVDPTDVRHQTGSYDKALCEHEKEHGLDKVKRWREALKEVADLSGKVLGQRCETEFIKDIVNDVMRKVNGNVSEGTLNGQVGFPSFDQSNETEFAIVQASGMQLDWYNLIWGTPFHPDHSLIAWLVVLNRLYTKDNLLNSGFPVNPTCVLCSKFPESRDHLFFSCEFSQSIWKELLLLSNINRPIGDWSAEFSWAKSHLQGMDCASIWLRLAWCAMLYYVWTARNAWIFQRQPSSPAFIVKSILIEVRKIIFGNPYLVNQFPMSVLPGQLMQWGLIP